MATRSLMTLDYVNYQTNSILQKHARNRPLGDIEHRHCYVPPQPVLSCRTVDIDLPGTRTYRPRSTLDILDEQQRLIRHLYIKQRASTSAPPRQRRQPSAKPKSEGTRSRIEVQGRPLTSSSQSRYQNENIDPAPLKRRPKTTGRLKNIQPATDCFMVVKVDQDLLESSRNSRDLTNQIRSHWRSENNNLAVGKFVRGQKRPDDVPPTLDAWLTFGGAAGDNSNGVIDAFASFKNSEEYYNIEGSVGSRVAQQLRKGDKIRIGINGILQSQDLKVKKRNKDSCADARGEEEPTTWIPENDKQPEVVEADEEHEEDPCEDVIASDRAVIEDTEETEEAQETSQGEYDFKALDLDGLDELLEDTMDIEEKSPKQNHSSGRLFDRQKKSERSKENSFSQENEMDGETKLKLTIPLSWDDQCNKQDIRVLQPKVAPKEVKRTVMSETYPIRFEKLSYGESRPRFSQPRPEGYKVKHRSANAPQDRRRGSAKVKVVYIDPLSKEDEEKVNKMSLDEVVNVHVGGCSREGTMTPNQQALRDGEDNELTTVNDLSDVKTRPSRQLSSRGSRRQSRPNSNYSQHSDRSGGYPSPKLKTLPVHSAVKDSADDLGIISYGARNHPPMNEMPRSAKPAGRMSPVRPLHRNGAGQGSSIKAGPLQGEAEYIQITSQLKLTNANGLPVPGQTGPLPFNVYNFSPNSNTPRDPDYQRDVYKPDKHGEGRDFSDYHSSPRVPVQTINSPSQMMSSINEISLSPTIRQAPPPDKATIEKEECGQGEESEGQAQSVTSESPAPTTVAISIPTADELSDKDSPDPSPSRRRDDGLTQKQRRERDMRNIQIDQLTDLIGDAIVDS